MQPIDKRIVEAALRRFDGQQVYVHFEVTPGGFVRNTKVNALRAMIAGDGPYRAALQLADDGWIRSEGLTDYEWHETEQLLLLAGHDEQGRLTVALELGVKPFEA